MNGELRSRLDQVEGHILEASKCAGRKPEEILLVAVTKTQPIEVIREAYDLGLRHFGENKVQELMEKAPLLPNDIKWHLVGHLQSNKAKYVASFIHMVHSIDSLSTAEELSKRAAQRERSIEILLEINISGESAKLGVAPNEAESFAKQIVERCPNLTLRGLMGVASHEEEIERTRPQFALLRNLRDEIRTRFATRSSFEQLSMGMTNDFEVAIEEGSTIVRIGSALFGERNYLIRS